METGYEGVWEETKKRNGGEKVKVKGISYGKEEGLGRSKNMTE